MYNDGFAGVCVFKRIFIRISASSLLIIGSLFLPPTAASAVNIKFYYCRDNFYDPPHYSNFSHTVEVRATGLIIAHSKIYWYDDYTLSKSKYSNKKTWETNEILDNNMDISFYSMIDSHSERDKTPKLIISSNEIYENLNDTTVTKLICFCGSYMSTPTFIVKDMGHIWRRKRAIQTML